jgi:hypothetical protein
MEMRRSCKARRKKQRQNVICTRNSYFLLSYIMSTFRKRHRANTQGKEDELPVQASGQQTRSSHQNAGTAKTMSSSAPPSKRAKANSKSSPRAPVTRKDIQATKGKSTTARNGNKNLLFHSKVPYDKFKGMQIGTAIQTTVMRVRDFVLLFCILNISPHVAETLHTRTKQKKLQNARPVVQKEDSKSDGEMSVDGELEDDDLIVEERGQEQGEASRLLEEEVFTSHFIAGFFLTILVGSTVFNEGAKSLYAAW